LPTFTYKAIAADGRQAGGSVVASTRHDALQRLAAEGRHPFDLREQAAGEGARSGVRFRRRAIRLSVVTRQLATLSESGISLVQSLNVLIEQTPDLRARQLLVEIREAVKGGSTFADALARHPDEFPPIMSSMVRVGERGGSLDQVLSQLSDLFENEESLRSEVRAAVAYPVLVLCLGIVSTILLVVFLIPRLEVLFAGVGQALPLPTRILIGLSHALAGYGWLLGLCAVGVVVAWRLALRRSAVRVFFDGCKLRVPWVGRVVRGAAIARFTRLLGLLAQGGISIVEGLEIVGSAVGNAKIARAVEDMARRIRTGESLATLMKQSKVFPPIPVQMVAVGEETGRMDQMLLRVADAYGREVTASTKILTSLLAPVLILCVACLVGFILLSMMLPIFQLSSLVG